ncbi:hypothetical protein, partial [Klebsiella pneumoniae]|uniref:hypothetical protein n=1 Tax=Klebsiella pneumoniae TaxID=573 RepID=UPI003F522EA2
YDVYCNRTHQIPNICPEIIKSIELQEGEWGSEGCTQTWSYVHGGKSCVAKAVVESIDRENKKMTFKLIDGELMGHYKSFKIAFHVTPK